MSERLVSFESYENLIQSRPYKFLPAEVDYRKAKGEEECHKCVHYYTRTVDGYAVCEILRDVRDDESENPIDPEFVCSYFSVNGDDFPLLKESK